MLFRRTTEAMAEKEVNFRLLRPTLRGISYDPQSVGVRIEAAPGEVPAQEPEGPSAGWSALHSWSVRYELRTGWGRLRVKQFLYDWGPCSTLDHAALCDYRPECLEVWPLDDVRVAWTGYDYAGSRALSMLAWGTNLELRELAGEHSEPYLLELARSFQPVSDRQTPPMAERSYWSRWPRYDRNMVRRPGYRLPSSLWLWRWPWQPVEHRWIRGMVDLDLPGSRARHGQVFSPDWVFDSACIFGDPSDAAEIQLLFQPRSKLGHAQLWLRRFARYAGSIREPAAGEWPLLDPSGYPQSIRRSRLDGSGGSRAFAASRTGGHGPHDLVWWRARHGFLLQISAAAGHDLGHATDLLSRLLDESVSVRD